MTAASGEIITISVGRLNPSDGSGQVSSVGGEATTSGYPGVFG